MFVVFTFYVKPYLNYDRSDMQLNGLKKFHKQLKATLITRKVLFKIFK